MLIITGLCPEPTAMPELESPVHAPGALSAPGEFEIGWNGRGTHLMFQRVLSLVTVSDKIPTLDRCAARVGAPAGCRPFRGKESSNMVQRVWEQSSVACRVFAGFLKEASRLADAGLCTTAAMTEVVEDALRLQFRGWIYG